MKKLIVAALLALAGCALNSTVVDPALKTLAQIGNTAQSDLQNTEAVAKAATPPDTDGYNCAAAVLVVNSQIMQVNAANNTANAGIFTAAEMASLFQPGSAQYNQAVNTIGTGCIAKANDVLGAANVVAAGGVMAILPQVIPLAAATP